jgi:type II secretory pathway pseudopilin PulG
MRSYRNVLGRGLFSLMELAIVLTVLGLVATIVGPRMSRAAAGPSPHLSENVLTGQLRMLRAAIDEYAGEHGGRFPEGDADGVVQQLTGYSDFLGNASATRTARHRLGPYLREIPAILVGSNRGGAALALPGHPARAAAWFYNPGTGEIRVNSRSEDPPF